MTAVIRDRQWAVNQMNKVWCETMIAVFQKCLQHGCCSQASRDGFTASSRKTVSFVERQTIVSQKMTVNGYLETTEGRYSYHALPAIQLQTLSSSL